MIFQWGDVIVPQGELSACINLKQEILPSVYAAYWKAADLETAAISPGMHCCSRCDLDRDRRLRLAWWGGQYCRSCFWDLLAILVHTSDKQMEPDISGQDFSCWASRWNPLYIPYLYIPYVYTVYIIFFFFCFFWGGGCICICIYIYIYIYIYILGKIFIIN